MSTRTARRSIALLLLAAAIVATRPAPARADSYPRQRGIDVVAYVFRLELNDGTSAIAGEADIDVAFRADGVREIWLDLVGPSPDGKTGMTVERVTSDGRSLPFSHEHDRLRIDLPDGGKAGDRRRLTVRYAGTPADGLIAGRNRDGDPVFFGDNFPNRARHWLPTIDHPSDKAACEFVVTAPETYQVVAPGALVETTSLAGGRRLTRYREEAPITTYCMVIGVARFAVETIGQVGGAPVQSWVYAPERNAGFSDFRLALGPMQFYTKAIGPYPYEKLANVQSKTRYGGMENASAIFYAERVVTGQGRNADLFAHEIAHQWFGDSVTESDWDHTWLSEGFATYLTHLYDERTAGRDALVQGMRRDRDAVVRYNEKNREAAVITPADPALDNILSTNSYQKGGWVLHMLRRQVGDAAFWKGLAAY
jgi:aminopeptidase N